MAVHYRALTAIRPPRPPESWNEWSSTDVNQLVDYGGYECARRLRLPVAIDPWRTVRVELPFVKPPEGTIIEVVLRDMDDHSVVLRLDDRVGMKWFEFR